ncbi:FmdB family zinc ribbon protein [Nesterenkonia natronophila]|uniref:FmdB family transcriptional regulator n=1 Tax=Nesterenkonia natronophila TaxID=2174932 RepID=A0A3A4FIC8_9MICC|nr:FmdB family zinc ribbon protein [Nesterenkonia natronophila]RJN32085.1 FmdB family transcriptional regulator [Nesterenkonia natronophila]
MPTYAYACKECHYAFDAVQSFSENSLTECPQCTGQLRKKFGNVGVTFKGSGFYRTDSRKTASSSSSSAEGTSSASSSEGSSSEKSASPSSSSADSGSSSAKAPAASSS